MTDQYRIRWARVVTWPEFRREPMCIAERNGRFWWTEVGDWRRQEWQAESDIQEDRNNRRPLPPTRLVDGTPLTTAADKAGNPPPPPKR